MLSFKLICTLFGVSVFIALASTAFCPDHKTKCRPNQTCCSNKRGSFGCCPYPGATCCSDGAHCCPHGSTCDIEHGRCIPGTPEEPEGWTMIYNSFTEEEWNNQNLAEEQSNGEGMNNRQNATILKKQTCGSGPDTCPDSYTCCLLSSGGFGCCPFQGATCCPDKIHCCPHGKRCDDRGRRCV